MYYIKQCYHYITAKVALKAGYYQTEVLCGFYVFSPEFYEPFFCFIEDIDCWTGSVGSNNHS